MATAINTQDFFNSEEFSDVIIRAEGNDIKCHKLILSSRSEYFANLIRYSPFTEDGSSIVIELDDTDRYPYVRAMIPYIYTSDHQDSVACTTSWLFQLGVAQIAHKYSLSQLEEAATLKFQRILQATTDTDTIVDVFHLLRKPEYSTFAEEKLQDFASMLKQKHRVALTEDPRFALMEDDKDLMRTALERLRYAHHRTERWFRKCNICGKGDIVEEQPIGELCCSAEVDVDFCWIFRDPEVVVCLT